MESIYFYNGNFSAVMEFAERLSYFGLATSLIIYLTKVIHQDIKTAAKSVNYWFGVTTMMPLLGGFLADAYLGRFSTILISSIVYILGLLLLTMSQIVPSLKPCGIQLCQEPRRTHELFFFLSIYLISIGTGGHKPSLESFGADQFDDDHPKERRGKMSFFNWWTLGVSCGLLFGVTVIVYVQEHVSWAAADIVLAAVMASTLVILIVGRPFYRYRKATGSPLTPMIQVLAAAIAKRNHLHPAKPDQLYEVSRSDKTQGRLLCHTEKLKFLDKAAILEDNENPAEKKRNPWRLATVTKVEEMKLVINMIPIWLTTLPFGIGVAQVTTFFVKQGTTLDRKITQDFIIPSASVTAFIAVGVIMTVTIYDKVLIPLLRRLNGNERGIQILQRIGIGMILSVTTMVVAALVERKRLRMVEKDPLNGSMSMSVFWLAPQFLLSGISDAFTLVGLQEYFYDQVPDSMRSLGIAFYLSLIGGGSFLSSLLITIVDVLSEKGGKSWFAKDLNGSRLDYFYWLLAAIAVVDLGVFVFVARQYSYKNVERTTPVADCYEGDLVQENMA